MRTHGWAGSPPQSDDEAVARIVSAALTVVEQRGTDITVADVARLLGVTRQTVYRYFDGTDALLMAAATAAATEFLDTVRTLVGGEDRPTEAVVTAVAHTLELLPDRRPMHLLIDPAQHGRFSAGITSGVARGFARAMLDNLPVDWRSAGFDDTAMDELVEFVLRVIQSYVVDPGDPPRTGDDLRGYLSRWIGPAVTAHTGVGQPATVTASVAPSS
ncbi:TetR/AcrR family transcriptional regulator [Rhodococcus gannanensis]|uniref:TetR/AcrR family transcriptional regulator n=1 Tax=Rhodococcus gannanensis TaxID=1960308 RepID=A0ABW4P6U4_9NOCA